MNKSIQALVSSKNPAIHPSEFSAPNTESISKKFRPTKGHVALVIVSLISLLIVIFISLARSVDVRAIEKNLSKPGEYLKLNANITYASSLKLPLGNRVLLLPGQHKISLSIDGYQSVERILEIGPDANQSFELELRRLPGSLEVKIEATNGELIEQVGSLVIDGDIKQSVPSLVTNLAAGKHELVIDAPLYRPVTQPVLVNGKGETQSITVELEPAWAEYSFVSQPEGANVFIDGEIKGNTPLNLKIEEGSHTLRIQAEKFKPYERDIGVVAGLNLAIPSVDLIPADGVLNLRSLPSGAAVILNKEYRGNTPLTLTLAPNTPQNLKFYKAGYQVQSKRFVVNAAQVLDEKIALKSDIISVKISVSPNDARVYVDGVAQGQGSQTLNLTALPHRISVRKNGYVPYASEIIPTRSNAQIVRVTLLTKEQHYWAQVPDQYTTRYGHDMRLFKDLGKVSMGSSRRENGRRANEAVYQAHLTKPFYVATKETTNKQFRAYRSAHNSGNYKGKSLDAQKVPVSNVSWQQAALYCNWLSNKEGLDPFYQTTKGFISGHHKDHNGYRLLTEVEWAWLARNKGNELLLYPWGKGEAPSSKTGNYADSKAASILTFILPEYDDGYKGPSPVGRFNANHRGIFDLDGNVSEWMHDWYSAKGNSELSGKDALVDPLGPDIGEFHVVRGASWAKGYLPQLRLAYRDYAAKGKHDIGFRIARYAGLNKEK